MTAVKIYLDDTREAPQGWTRCYWPSEVIALLEAGGVAELSLDHDLGDDERGTGYDVLRWLEEAVALRGVVPPARIVIHSANASAWTKMVQAIESIERLASR